MIPINPVQFSVVREDPLVDIKIIEEFKLKNILLIASGGCTALALKNKWQDKPITVFDPNKAQLDLMKDKFSASKIEDQKLRHEIFNVENDHASGLNAKGNFESLFRMFRNFLWEFVADKHEWKEIFSEGSSKRLERVLANKYWMVSFDIFFHENFLEAMFGTAAIQHAPKGSYPSYFRERIEEGLRRRDAIHNYFLHHIFLGCYLNDPKSYPEYIDSCLNDHGIKYINGYLQDVQALGKYDYIMLSNIFDWMSYSEVSDHIKILNQETSKGSVVCFRQLNNTKDYSDLLSPNFQSEETISDELYKVDRSLFYNSLKIFRKVKD